MHARWVVSFHAVDPRFIQREVLPCLLGDPLPDTLIARGHALMLARRVCAGYRRAVRARVKRHENALLQAKARKPSALGRLLGGVGLASKAATPEDSPFHAAYSKLDRALHLESRPFLALEPGQAAFERAYDVFMAAPDPDGLDAQCRAMLTDAHRTLSGTTSEPEPAYAEDLFARDLAAFMTARDQLLSLRVVHGEDELPAFLPAAREDTDVHPVSAWLGQNLPYAVFQLLAHFFPGSIAYSDVWPSRLLERVGAPVQTWFRPSVWPLASALERITTHVALEERTIMGARSLGGVVPAAQVPAVWAALEAHRGDIIADARQEHMESAVRAALKSMREQLMLAASRDWGFVEAAGLYALRVPH